MKILVVEDEVMLADSIRAMLEKRGFRVECVYDGESGAEYALTGIYDLLILVVMCVLFVLTFVLQQRWVFAGNKSRNEG